MTKRKSVKIGFEEWIKVVVQNDPTAVKQLLCMAGLCIASLIVALRFSGWVGQFAAGKVVLLGLNFGVGFSFLVTLLYVWRKSCRNPPPYLLEHVRRKKR